MCKGLAIVAEMDIENLIEAIEKKHHDLEVTKSYGVEENKSMISAILNDIELLTQKLNSRKKDLLRYNKGGNKND